MADTMTLEELRARLYPTGDDGEWFDRDELALMIRGIDAAIKQRDQNADVCVWSEDEDGNWDTGCGNMFVLTEGTPYDNEMGFCCYCGHKLDQETQENAAMAKESGNG